MYTYKCTYRCTSLCIHAHIHHALICIPAQLHILCDCTAQGPNQSQPIRGELERLNEHAKHDKKEEGEDDEERQARDHEEGKEEESSQHTHAAEPHTNVSQVLEYTCACMHHVRNDTSSHKLMHRIVHV